LEEYLTSPEGGNLRVVGESRYRILRYVKNQSDMKLDHVKWFRSVVWDTEKNIPVCVAPPKAESNDPPTGEDISLYIQDFLDGTMLNTFITKENPNDLVLTSRTQLGATGSFYSKKTFGEMFDDALKEMGYSSREDLHSCLPKPTSDLSATFVSFLLQHPEHRVVSRVRNPRLLMIHVGEVDEEGGVEIREDLTGFPLYSQFLIPAYPMTGFRKKTDLDSFVKGCCESKGWFFQGLYFKNQKGQRWRVRNPNYLYLRELRGSEASDVDRFLRLRSQGKVPEYLKHYGEERQTFWDLEQKLRAQTNTIYESYGEVHKAHAKKLADLPKAIQPFVFRLHSYYLSDLKPNQGAIKMKDAVSIVNTMPSFEQKRLLVDV
jgi:hypothetical protein